jgi:hypothetical protein
MLQCHASSVVSVTHFYVSDHPDQLLVRHLCGGGRRNRGALVSEGRHRYGGGAATVSKSYTPNLCCVKEKERATDLELQAVLVG